MQATSPEITNFPLVARVGAGPVIDTPTERLEICMSAFQTGGNFLVTEVVAQPGSGPTYHVHSFEDEVFIVLEGELEVLVNGERHLLGPGDKAYGPRNVPHTYRAAGECPARFLVIVTGSNFETFFPRFAEAIESGDLRRADRVAGEHGIEFFAPL